MLLVGAIITLYADVFAVFAGPVIILFVAWLMSYVLEPPVSFIQRHLPFRGRGVAVATTYVVTAVVAFVVIAAAVVAVINAAVAFTDNLPAILAKVGDVLRPLIERLGLTLPNSGSVVESIQRFLAENASEIADAVTGTARNLIVIVASLITAIIISVGLAMGQVSLLGWMRRFLPSSTYRDLTELERAIAVSFGGFVRGRLLIGAIYGGVIGIAAVILGIPYGALIAVIAGLIVFIPWIGPLIGWAVLPAFALILAPDGRRAGGRHQHRDGGRHPGRRHPVRDGRGRPDAARRGLRRGHPRIGDRRGPRRDLRHPDRGRDPGRDRLPAPARRAAAGEDASRHAAERPAPTQQPRRLRALEPYRSNQAVVSCGTFASSMSARCSRALPADTATPRRLPAASVAPDQCASASIRLIAAM